jgi:Domain of unknown function (DUF4157)
MMSEALASPGTAIEPKTRSVMESRFRTSFERVRIHADGAAADSAAHFGAAAFSAGNHIVFAPGEYAPNTDAGFRLLTHEMAHVYQQQSPSNQIPDRIGRSSSAEQFAIACSNQSPASSVPLASGLVAPAFMPSIAEKILKWTAKKLEKNTVRTISKHVARHARQIAGRAIHSIFKHPRKIRSLVETAVREATEIAGRHAAAGTEKVVEEGAIRISRQATGTPGKFRLLIQKVFKEEIGTAGERVLRIVLDQSGRLVTAFPADRLIVLGLTVAGVEAFTAGTAKAGGILQDRAERQAAIEEKNDKKTDLWDWVPFIGDIWGGDLNSGEGEMLREDDEDRRIEKLIEDTIKDIEETEKRSFDEPHRKEIEDVIRSAIATPLIMNDPEE